ncbi:hypothetical protein [Methanimicrococcus blatticola]|uniref:Uncharacterized protein n=1 Tax=Methanimicrococcus blatticola TaxID=91560 RepID=A0A484F8A6_9EURY|nr:hypothetical protein [Methanimicrococcus blatticola]MBZ3935025.1 hypothetical protein [Methanimicrococcus blatticola]MCC2508877.1 hypothetical protein [Methanimicrococcus blatticola]TDQ71096.1 hypothetical protein C7391_0195 [Methanimicrococcus blatticola]
MSENSPVSVFSNKKFYVLVAIGLIIFAAGTVFAYSAKSNLKDKDLPADDFQKQERIYAVAKIASMVGFIIALIPSVQILQNTILNERAKTTEGSDVSVKEEKNNEEDE